MPGSKLNLSINTPITLHFTMFWKVLEAAGDPSGGIILLLSDGKENVEPFIADLKDDIIDAGVIVDTIAFTQMADGGLYDLAVMTGK